MFGGSICRPTNSSTLRSYPLDEPKEAEIFSTLCRKERQIHSCLMGPCWQSRCGSNFGWVLCTIFCEILFIEIDRALAIVMQMNRQAVGTRNALLDKKRHVPGKNWAGQDLLRPQLQAAEDNITPGCNNNILFGYNGSAVTRIAY